MVPLSARRIKAVDNLINLNSKLSCNYEIFRILYSWRMGFKQAKFAVLMALEKGDFLHEARNNINEKNWLKTGQVSVSEVVEIIKICNGNHHTESPHHWISSVTVHVIKRDGWYIKFYFLEPNTYFISVHR